MSAKKIPEVSAKQLRCDLGDILGRARYGQQITVITLRGRRIAAIVPIRHLSPRRESCAISSLKKIVAADGVLKGHENYLTKTEIIALARSSLAKG